MYTYLKNNPFPNLDWRTNAVYEAFTFKEIADAPIKEVAAPEETTDPEETATPGIAHRKKAARRLSPARLTRPKPRAKRNGSQQRYVLTPSHGLGDGRLEGKEHTISLQYHYPFICVCERFGVNAALVNLTTGTVREMRREDYHCDVSSYSIGFGLRGLCHLHIQQSFGFVRY